MLTGTTFCPVTGLTAQGIPSFMLTAGKVEALTLEMKSLRETLQSQFNQFTEPILNELKSIPGQVKEVMMDNFQIEGVQQITRTDLQGLADAITSKFTVMLEDHMKGLTIAVQPTPPASSETQCTPRKWKSWVWGERIHPVPEGYILPRPSVKSFFFLYHLGNAQDGIAPLKQLCKHDVKSADWTQMSRSKGVMLEIEKHAKDGGLVESTKNLSDLSPTDLSLVFDGGFQKLLDHIYPLPGERDAEKCIGTIYNRLQAARKRSMPSVDQHN